MPVTVFCLVKGNVVLLDISPATHALLRRTMEKFEIPYVQNILAPAFLKYGKREEAIVKYIREDLPKERR